MKHFRYFAPLISCAQIIVGVVCLLFPASVLANSIPEEQHEQTEMITLRWLTQNMDLFAAYKANLGYVWS